MEAALKDFKANVDSLYVGERHNDPEIEDLIYDENDLLERIKDINLNRQQVQDLMKRIEELQKQVRLQNTVLMFPRMPVFAFILLCFFSEFLTEAGFSKE